MKAVRDPIQSQPYVVKLNGNIYNLVIIQAKKEVRIYNTLYV